MKKLIIDNQDLEEMEKSFYNNLISNKGGKLASEEQLTELIKKVNERIK